MPRNLVRATGLLLSFVLVAVSCKTADDPADSSSGDDGATKTTVAAEKLDYEKLGLWDDGECDSSKPELKIGLMTVFQSPVISLEDQALGLEAAAAAFNKRGGANGGCITVFTCDDGGQVDQAVACARKVDEEGVVATVNDQGTAGQADVSEAMATAGISRIAGNVVPDDWGDDNAYPIDASGTGVTFLLPQALLDRDVDKIGSVRVDLAAASALTSFLETVYKDKGVEFAYDAPVPGGTTDFSQFILGAQEAGVGGVMLALGEQEAIQVVRAGQQLNTPLVIGSSLGSFSRSNIAELGDFATQMQFLWSFPPATFDLPVYDVLRADLAASGEDSLQAENLKASPMRSWIGLYALLYMIRDSGLTDFTRPNIKTMLDAAKDVPMLGIFGDENWTPNTDHPGLFQRAGTNHWSTYRWDPDAESPDGEKGNFVADQDVNFDDVLCGSPMGAPGPC